MGDDEKTPLMSGGGGDLTSYTSISHHGHEPLNHVGLTKSENRWRWLSITITYLGTFVMFIQNSMYWASLWPYLSQIDKTANETFFGFCIAAYSFGTVIASPILGLWSNKAKQVRWPCVTGLVINMGGNILMAFVESFPSNHKWILLIARFIQGLGAGNTGPFLSYVASATTMDERNWAMSMQAATVSMAILLGPGIQSALTPVGYPGIVVGQFRLNMYTAPAYASLLICILLIVLLLTVFKEYEVGIKKNKNGDDSEDEVQKPFDVWGAIACIWCRFVILFCVVYDNTIGSPFTMIMFKWTRSEAVLYNGLIEAISGIIDFFGNLIVGNVVLKYVRERNLMIAGLFCFMVFYIISYSYPGLPMLHRELPVFINGSLATTTVLTSPAGKDTTQCVYEWCDTTTRIYFWQYLAGYFFIVMAFVLCFTPTSTLYTKLLGPRRQGFMQGMYMAGGSLANTISPIVVSSVFEAYGPKVAWLIASAMLVVSIIFVSSCYKRLVPFQEEDDFLPDGFTESTGSRKSSNASHAPRTRKISRLLPAEFTGFGDQIEVY